MRHRTSYVRFARGAFSLSALLLLLACGADSKGKRNGPCERAELDACGSSCSGAQSCAAGLYCDGASVCYAQCAPATATADCSADEACAADGHCVAASNSDGGNGGGTANTGASASGSSGSGGSNSNVCADVALKANVTTPNVVLIIDQSGSMTDKFGNGSRWTVLKDALLSDTGLIAELQSVVRFGVALYTYDEQKDKTCPIITPGNISVALNALDGIRGVYKPAEPGDNTPTGESIEAVLTQVQTLGLTSVDSVDPTIFVLATDGNPDTCELPDQGAFNSANSKVATKRSVDAVKKAYAAGVRTYVIAVASETDLAQTHVNDLANAGVGDPAAASIKSAPSYRVDDDKGLRDALRTIVSGELSCEVKLEGKIIGDPCLGTVKLNGSTLTCSDANGWKLIDESTIELSGTSCNALKLGQTLEATFPCNSVVVL